ncbi:hypothetical protein L9F63_003012, partial [Diploptera punctata]
SVCCSSSNRAAPLQYLFRYFISLSLSLSFSLFLSLSLSPCPFSLFFPRSPQYHFLFLFILFFPNVYLFIV